MRRTVVPREYPHHSYFGASALALIALTVGGGFTGFALTLQYLLALQAQQPIYFLTAFAFLALYAFVTLSGLLFVHNPQRTLPLFIAVGLQIPWISSPLLAYRFTAGLQATVGLTGGTFAWRLGLGSDWHCSVFQKLPWGAGVNLIAVLMLVLLAHSHVRQSPCPLVDVPKSVASD